MKNVAGFHSFDLGILLLVVEAEDFRRGLGTKFLQNDVDATLCTPAYLRAWLFGGRYLLNPSKDVRKLGGAKRICWRVATLFMVE